MPRILVVEDNPTNLDLMVYLLRAFGYSPLIARDGEQGLEIARREMPELIICDVHMPNMDGYELARRLKAHPSLSQVPLIAVTALAMVGDREKILAAGFDGYIAKPVAPMTFVEQVELFLRPEQRIPKKRAVTAEQPTAPAESAGLRILVVDDSPVNRELLRSIFAPFGYEVLLAANVQEGLSLARQSRPDLILSDLHMPGEDGIFFVRAVKAEPRLRLIPFVFISSSTFVDKDRIFALEQGANYFIARPIEPQALLDAVQAVLNDERKQAGISGKREGW